MANPVLLQLALGGLLVLVVVLGVKLRRRTKALEEQQGYNAALQEICQQQCNALKEAQSGN